MKEPLGHGSVPFGNKQPETIKERLETELFRDDHGLAAIPKGKHTCG